MPAEKATAIVLRSIDFSETSLIVTLMTREFGKVRALAKGGKRLKGPFDSALDLLSLSRVVFLRKSSDALDLLTEAKLLRRFRVPGRRLEALYAAYYVAELSDAMTDDYDPHPELFDLADEALEALSAGEPTENRVLRFELGALRLLGHLPALEHCAECGRAVPPGVEKVAFGHADGGVLCSACRKGKHQIAMLATAALRTMAVLAGDDAAAWRQLEIDPRARGQIRGALNRCLYNLLGRKPRMHEYLFAR